MSELTKPLTADELLDVETQLKNLYLYLDRPIKKEQFTLFYDEIIRSGKPYSAIIAGLNALKMHQGQRLTLEDIFNAILAFCKESDEKVHCDDCLGSGYFLVKDENGVARAKACMCQNGERAVRQGIKRMTPFDKAAML